MGTAKLHQQLEKSQLSSDLLSQEIFSSKISLKEIGSKKKAPGQQLFWLLSLQDHPFLGVCGVWMGSRWMDGQADEQTSKGTNT
jgi:hypothetical protein